MSKRKKRGGRCCSYTVVIKNMLIQLHVKNLALIEEIEVEFGPGLNILTGETGAGKSILLGSMQLILGAKISKAMIRENAPYALVELLFQIEDLRTKEMLEALEIYTEEEQILLSRKIVGGRSINKINGETVTVGQMKAAASCLLDIHGQHEHQSLLYPEKQLEILDSFGQDEIKNKKDQVRQQYLKFKRFQEEVKSLDIDEEQRNREISFLEYEINEIEKANLRKGEDEELELQYRKLGNSKTIVEAVSEVYRETGYERNGAGEYVGNAMRELGRVVQYDSELNGFTEILTEIDGLLNDFNRELSAYIEKLTFDDQSFFELEKRLDTINSLKAKYGQNIDDILLYKEKQLSQLEIYRTYDERYALAKKRLEEAEKQLEAACYELSECRHGYAKELEAQVKNGLRDLNFLDVKFELRFMKKKNYSSNGFDDVTYMISTNPGETIKPLGEIVSGGELSRIMLALKAILADRDEIETLIFDEIDTGISGRTAQKVSEKMAVIGKQHQVLCITHLPQIAAMADTHFEIKKIVQESETKTQIHSLNEEDSIKELARLLGGAEITNAVLENAREMKKLAVNTKNK